MHALDEIMHSTRSGSSKWMWAEDTLVMIRELVLAEGSVSRIAPTLLTVDAELLEAFVDHRGWTILLTTTVILCVLQGST